MTLAKVIKGATPQEAKRILHLLNDQNPALQIPKEFIDNCVTFEGEADPLYPGNLKAGAVGAALQAAIGAVASQIAEQRYGVHNNVKVNTDAASYYLGHVVLFEAGGKRLPGALALAPKWEQGAMDSVIGMAATGIYRTKDNRDYFLHGSLDSYPLVTKTMGLDWDEPSAKTKEGAREYLGAWVAKHTAQEIEDKMILDRQCGSICFMPEEWRKSEMGAALLARPLVDIRRTGDEVGCPLSPPTSWPANDPARKRPLDGVKVVEMVRVIAGPTVGRQLAELGATVIKVNPPHLRDISLFQFTLTTGVRTTLLDIRKKDDRDQLETLIGEADVFVDGFRPGSLLMKGYGEREVLRLARKHRGPHASVVYLHECCYGVEGPYAGRPGWQQIADAASGMCQVQAESLGTKGAVLPPLPISDMHTGVLGALLAIVGLRERANKGGSYSATAALTHMNMFVFSDEVGVYPQEIVEKVQKEFEWAPTEPGSSVLELLFMISTRWIKHRPHHFDFKSSPFFVTFDGEDRTPYGSSTVMAPIAQLDVNPSYWNHGPQPFGHNKATWQD